MKLKGDGLWPKEEQERGGKEIGRGENVVEEEEGGKRERVSGSREEVPTRAH